MEEKASVCHFFPLVSWLPHVRFNSLERQNIFSRRSSVLSPHRLCFTVLPAQKNSSLLNTFVTSVHTDSKTISLCLLSSVSEVIVKAGVVWPIQVAAVRHPSYTAAGRSSCRAAAERGTRDIIFTSLMFFAFAFLSCVCLFILLSRSPPRFTSCPASPRCCSRVSP